MSSFLDILAAPGQMRLRYTFVDCAGGGLAPVVPRPALSVRPQVGEHGMDPAVCGIAGKELKLVEDHADVGLNGLMTDVQELTDCAVRVTFGHEGVMLVTSVSEFCKFLTRMGITKGLRRCFRT